MAKRNRINTIIWLIVIGTWLLSCSGDPEKSNEKKLQDSIASTKKDSNAYRDPTLPPSPDYTGDHIVKYKDGITSIRGFFRFGKKHGKWAAFFPSGELQSETEFSNGNKTGKTMVWYPNGKIMYEGSYTNDERTGTWTTYDSTGKITSQVSYPEKK